MCVYMIVVCVCVVCICVLIPTHLWKSENNFIESDHSFHLYGGSRDLAQVSKYLNQVPLFAQPSGQFLVI